MVQPFECPRRKAADQKQPAGFTERPFAQVASNARSGRNKIAKTLRRHRWNELDNFVIGYLLSMEWIVLDNALNLGPSFCNGKNDAASARLFTPRKQKLARCVVVLQELAVFFNKTINFGHWLDVVKQYNEHKR